MSIEIEFVHNGNTYDVAFERESKVSVDNDYGADADGRRGTRAVFVDDDEAAEIEVNGIPLALLSEEFQKEVTEAVALWMNENPPEEPDDDGPEHDDIDR